MLLEHILLVLFATGRQLQVVHVVLDCVGRRLPLGGSNRLRIFTRSIVRISSVLLFGVVLRVGFVMGRVPIIKTAVWCERRQRW